MNLILKYKGKQVADLGAADQFMITGLVVESKDGDIIDHRLTQSQHYIIKTMMSLASLHPKYEELHGISDDIDNMIENFQYMVLCYGKMYMLLNILENKDFTVEIE